MTPIPGVIHTIMIISPLYAGGRVCRASYTSLGGTISFFIRGPTTAQMPSDSYIQPGAHARAPVCGHAPTDLADWQRPNTRVLLYYCIPNAVHLLSYTYCCAPTVPLLHTYRARRRGAYRGNVVQKQIAIRTFFFLQLSLTLARATHSGVSSGVGAPRVDPTLDRPGWSGN